MSLRVYGVARTRAFRALWIAEELGIAYEHVPVEIGEEGARTPESLAITLYLAKKYSAGKLYPASPEGEARAWQWSFWAVGEVDRGVNIWSLHAMRLPADERNVALRDEALKVLAAPFKVLDAAVAAQPY